MRMKGNRRRVKKRKRSGDNLKMRFIMVIAIMIAAILLGYLTARFVIGPLLGYNADESPIKIAEEHEGDTDNGDSESETEANGVTSEVSSSPESGYAIQFGAFSTEEAARELKEALLEKGIETSIIQEDDIYKVISPVINEKEEATEKLSELQEKEVTDVFIASF